VPKRIRAAYVSRPSINSSASGERLALIPPGDTGIGGPACPAGAEIRHRRRIKIGQPGGGANFGGKVRPGFGDDRARTSVGDAEDNPAVLNSSRVPSGAFSQV
jgi:hypothetical protein